MKTQIRSEKLKASIEFFADRVPQTVQKTRPLLPTTVPLCHAKFAGDELIDLLDELLMYNNRLWLWLDNCIPWFDLDVQIGSTDCVGRIPNIGSQAP